MQIAIEPALAQKLSEPLLQPLIARANAHRRFPQLRFRDIYSELMLQALDVDTGRLRHDGEAMLGSCLRARWIENESANFLRSHPRALGISLGSGLDTLYLRLCDALGDMSCEWYDIDRPDVIALKRSLLTETNQYRMHTCDPENPLAAIDKLQWQPGQPALFVFDGLLMYYSPETVMALLMKIVSDACWRGSAVSIVFDYCSPYMARQSRRRATAISRRPALQWSMEHPDELQWLHPQLRMLNTYDLTRHSHLIPRLTGWLHRRFTGRLLYGCAHMHLDGAVPVCPHAVPSGNSEGCNTLSLHRHHQAGATWQASFRNGKFYRMAR